MVDLTHLWRLSNYDIRTRFEALERKIIELENRIKELEKDGRQRFSEKNS